MSAPKLNLAAVSSTSVRPQVLSEFSETDQEVILKNVEKRMSTSENNASTYLERQGFTSQQIQQTIAYVQDAADATPPFEEGAELVKIKNDYYKLGKVLGTGKYAEVRLAVKQDTQKKVALKVLYTDVSNRKLKILRNQIRDEFKALRKIKHTNVVKLINYDIRTHIKMNNTPRKCMIQVQELLSNGELFDYVNYCGSFPPEVCRYVFHQFMSGLHACHAVHIAHRDLKPDNILLGDDFTLKIVDFGFAKKFVSEEQRRFMATQLGTRGYMAPEIYQGKPYTEKCDVFSAGIILFILLAGYPPLQEAKRGDWWFQRLQEGRYARFWQAHEQGNQSFEREAKELIIRMLEPRTSERWSTQQILDCDWFKLPTVNKKQYQRELYRRKQMIEQKKSKEIHSVTRNTEYDLIKSTLTEKGEKIRLQDLMEPLRKTKMASVTNQEELLQIMGEIAKQNPCIAEDLKYVQYKLSTPKEIADVLANATSYTDVQECVKLEDNPAQELCRILNQSILDQVFTETSAKVSTEKEQFYNLQEIELPVFDDNLYQLPLTTYKIRCGLSIFNCALRLFMKSGTFHPGQMQIVHTEAKTMIKFKVPISHDFGDGTPKETRTYKMFVEVQCYQQPEQENVMIVAVRKKDQNFMTTEAFKQFCDALFLHSALRVFVIADGPSTETGEN